MNNIRLINIIRRKRNIKEKVILIWLEEEMKKRSVLALLESFFLVFQFISFIKDSHLKELKKLICIANMFKNGQIFIDKNSIN